MPQECALVRSDKLAKLIEVFEHFHGGIAKLDDPTAKRLVDNWTGIRDQYVTATVAPRSALAAGMEQGLREAPILVQSMQPEARKCASHALAAATSAHYPAFLAKEAERLAKIKTRGCIRGEAEFYFVRHRIDLLEGDPKQEEELRLLHELTDRFEGKLK